VVWPQFTPTALPIRDAQIGRQVQETEGYVNNTSLFARTKGWVKESTQTTSTTESITSQFGASFWKCYQHHRSCLSRHKNTLPFWIQPILALDLFFPIFIPFLCIPLFFTLLLLPQSSSFPPNMQSVKGMSYSTTTAQSTTTATSTPPTNMARNAESSFSQDNPAYNTNSELAIEKPKIPNLIKYDGFHSSSFHLLVELGTNPRLVLDDGFLAKLLLPRLVMVLTEHQKKEISLVAGLSQFKCQFEVPQTWFKRFHAANARIMLSSKAQYATVWTHAVDCAIWSGHVDRCGLSAKQRELEIQQVRGLVNLPICLSLHSLLT
jgi:hypothetical protein